jgi:hypothetical protein
VYLVVAERPRMSLDDCRLHFRVACDPKLSS